MTDLHTQLTRQFFNIGRVCPQTGRPIPQRITRYQPHPQITVYYSKRLA